MLSIFFNVILPVFGLMLLGYVAVKAGWFNIAWQGGLAEFVTGFAAPVLLFKSLITADLPAQPPWNLFASYYLAAFLSLTLAALAGMFFLKQSYRESLVFALGATFGNSIMVGLPMVVLVLSESQALSYYLLVSVHMLLLNTPVMLAIELSASPGEHARSLTGRIARVLFGNPLLLGVAAGALYRALALPVPESLLRFTGLLGGAAAPVALFAMGASLTRFTLKGALGQALVATLLKLLVLPLLVLAGVTLFRLSPEARTCALLLAVQPTGITPFLLSGRYRLAEASTAATVALTTPAAALAAWVVLVFNPL